MSCVLLAENDFSLETGKDGNIFYFGESTKGKIVSNNPDVKKVYGTLEYYDSYGKFFKSEKISFNTDKKINLPNKKGCVEIKYNFTIMIITVVVTAQITLITKMIMPIATYD